MTCEVSLDEIGRLLHYSPESGALTWRLSRGGVAAGTTAGTLNSNGYVTVCVATKLFRAHRVAWALANGSWPVGDIDHIDGDRTNNRLLNLRQASRGANMQNQRKARSNSKIGMLGVSRNRARWMSRIKVDGITHHIGTFDTPALAHEAYVQRKRELHPMGML